MSCTSELSCLHHGKWHSSRQCVVTGQWFHSTSSLEPAIYHSPDLVRLGRGWPRREISYDCFSSSFLSTNPQIGPKLSFEHTTGHLRTFEQLKKHFDVSSCIHLDSTKSAGGVPRDPCRWVRPALQCARPNFLISFKSHTVTGATTANTESICQLTLCWMRAPRQIRYHRLYRGCLYNHMELRTSAGWMIIVACASNQGRD